MKKLFIICLMLLANTSLAEKLTYTKNSTSNIIQIPIKNTSNVAMTGLTYATNRVTLTGTVSSSSLVVTGSGTAFLSELAVGDVLYNRQTLPGTYSSSGTTITGVTSVSYWLQNLNVGDIIFNAAQDESRIVVSIQSETSATLNAAFTVNVSAGTTLRVERENRIIVLISSDTSLTLNSGFANNLSAGTIVRAKGLHCIYQRAKSSGISNIRLIPGTVGSYISGGFVETVIPGLYQLGIPDAAFLSGDDSFVVSCRGATNMAQIYEEFRLTDFDLNSGGVTVIDVDDAAIKSTSIQDGAFTGSKFPVDGVAQACGGCTSSQIKLSAGETSLTNDMVGNIISIVSGTGVRQTRVISAYDSSTKIATVSAAWNTNPSSDSGYVIPSFVASSGGSGTGASAADIWAYSTRSLTDKAGFGLANNAITSSTIQDGAFTGSKFPADGTITVKSGTTLSLSGGITRTGQFNSGWRIFVFNASNPAVASSCITASTNGSPDTVTTQDDISTDVTVSDGFSIIPDSLCGAQSELVSLPSTTPTILEMIKYVYQYGRNKVVTTDTSTTLYKNNGSSSLGAATLSDDGTSFTRDRIQ